MARKNVFYIRSDEYYTELLDELSKQPQSGSANSHSAMEETARSLLVGIDKSNDREGNLERTTKENLKSRLISPFSLMASSTLPPQLANLIPNKSDEAVSFRKKREEREINRSIVISNKNVRFKSTFPKRIFIPIQKSARNNELEARVEEEFLVPVREDPEKRAKLYEKLANFKADAIKERQNSKKKRLDHSNTRDKPKGLPTESRSDQRQTISPAVPIDEGEYNFTYTDRKAQERAERLERINIAKHWAILSSFLARVGYLNNFLARYRGEDMMRTQLKAASVIQIMWKSYKNKGMALILAYRLRVTEIDRKIFKERQAAASMMMDFFTNCNEIMPIMRLRKLIHDR